MIAAVLVSWCPGLGKASEDARERWLHAYVLVQTGRELGERELWPLALANYSAALEEFERLADDFPGFQPRLVSFRSEELKRQIAHANESMNAGEHDVALRYQDILESTRTGVSCRMTLNFETAYRYFANARWQLEALLEDEGESLAGALVEQRAYLDRVTEASRDALLEEPEGGIKAHHIEMDLASRLSIDRDQLPSFRESEPTASGMSSALFPDELVARVRGQWY